MIDWTSRFRPQLGDPSLQKRLETTLQAFLSLAEAAKNYPCIKRAWVEFLGEPNPDLAPSSKT